MGSQWMWRNARRRASSERRLWQQRDCAHCHQCGPSVSSSNPQQLLYLPLDWPARASATLPFARPTVPAGVHQCVELVPACQPTRACSAQSPVQGFQAAQIVQRRDGSSFPRERERNHCCRFAALLLPLRCGGGGGHGRRARSPPILLAREIFSRTTSAGTLFARSNPLATLSRNSLLAPPNAVGAQPSSSHATLRRRRCCHDGVGDPRCRGSGGGGCRRPRHTLDCCRRPPAALGVDCLGGRRRHVSLHALLHRRAYCCKVAVCFFEAQNAAGEGVL